MLKELNLSDQFAETQSFAKYDLLDRLGNDFSLYKKLLDDADEIEIIVNDLIKAIKEESIFKIKKSAHKLKGAAHNMAFKKLARLCLELEQTVCCESIRLNQLAMEVIAEWQRIQEILAVESSKFL